MPKDLLKVSTNLRGKMSGMTVITSSCKGNPHCEKLAQIKGSICEHCYAMRGLSYMRGPREAYTKNGELLSSDIIPTRELPFINATYCRLESHGDIINETHLENYMRICRHNPQTTFVLWTKMYELVYNYFKSHKAPKNFILVVSSLKVNQPMEEMLARFKGLGLKRVKLFTVYDKPYLAEHSEVSMWTNIKEVTKMSYPNDRIPDAPWIGMCEEDWDEHISRFYDDEDPDEDLEYETWRDEQDEEKYNK